MQRVFEICFAAVVMVFGGVSLLTNQRLYRFLVKPRFELGVFPADQSRLSVCGALPETAECLDDFETSTGYSQILVCSWTKHHRCTCA